MSVPNNSEVKISFPALYESVEIQSAEAQKTFLLIRFAEFSSLVLAALFGAIPNGEFWNAGSFLSLFCFAIALVLRVSGAAERAERKWYEARAAAESIKSSSWQYAVCGEAYRKEDKEAEERFLKSIREILKALKHLNVAAQADALTVTSEMRALRRANKNKRIDTYAQERVKDQLKWYARKANWNKEKAEKWRRILIVIEVGAIVLGLLRIKGIFDVDWLGILAAAAAGVAAWQQIKNFVYLSEAYSVTSHEINIISSQINSNVSEDVWAQTVHDAEAAFSREHKLWLSRRQGPEVS